MSESSHGAVLVPGQSARSDLRPYERAHDVEDPDGVLVVLETTRTRASAYDMTDGVTAADIHHEYPEADEIVVCAYERTLDRECPGWRGLSPDSLARVGVSERYHYPASRLDRYDEGNYTLVADGCRCEHCGTVVESTAAWVRHFVRGCRR